MPIQKPQADTLPKIKIQEEAAAPVCQQWGHLVEKEGLTLESAARSHKVDLGVLLKLNSFLGPQNKLLSPFHDLVVLPKRFSKVDGADICIRDKEDNLLGYDNRKYIPSFVKEVVEEWKNNFLSKFDASVQNSFGFELATHGPNYLSFNVDEDHSQITNVARKNTSFRFTIHSIKPDLSDVEAKIREAFASLPQEKKSLIQISGIKKSPTGDSCAVTFTLPKRI